MNPVSLLMARYQDPDVTPSQAPAWRARPDRSSPVRTGAASLPPAPATLSFRR
jgi:hypothetical protein